MPDAIPDEPSIRRVLFCLAEALLWSFAGAFLMWLTLPTNWDIQIERHADGLFRNDFARRWDGECAGWGRELAVTHILGDLGHWLSYVTIAMILLRLHPMISHNWRSKVTISLMFLFVIGCAFGHLLQAYTVVNPIYVAVATWKAINVCIGYTAAAFIAYGLAELFGRIMKDSRLQNHLKRAISDA